MLGQQWLEQVGVGSTVWQKWLLFWGQGGTIERDSSSCVVVHSVLHTTRLAPADLQEVCPAEVPDAPGLSTSRTKALQRPERCPATAWAPACRWLDIDSRDSKYGGRGIVNIPVVLPCRATGTAQVPRETASTRIERRRYSRPRSNAYAAQPPLDADGPVSGNTSTSRSSAVAISSSRRVCVESSSTPDAEGPAG